MTRNAPAELSPIIVGAATRDEVAGRIAMLELTRLAVRGRSERAPVYTVVPSRVHGDLAGPHADFLSALDAGDLSAARSRAADCAALWPALDRFYAARLREVGGGHE